MDARVAGVVVEWTPALADAVRGIGPACAELAAALDDLVAQWDREYQERELPPGRARARVGEGKWPMTSPAAEPVNKYRVAVAPAADPDKPIGVGILTAPDLREVVVVALGRRQAL